MDPIITFIHLAFVAFITLFPPVNPIGTAFIIDPLLGNLNPQEELLLQKK